MPIDRLLQNRREEILRIAEHCGARNVRVFGSRARGEARPGSDFDILVTVGEHTSLLEIVAIKQDLEGLLGPPCTFSLKMPSAPYIRAQVLAEAVVL